MAAVGAGRSTGADIVPHVTLNSGHAMPVLGFGTASPEGLPADLAGLLLHAMRLGYRHFDTAALYGSEAALGAAVAEAVRVGVVASRADLFITSKLWITDAHPDLVLPALKGSLARLGLDYLDLFLIHYPVRITHAPAVAAWTFSKDDLLPFDMEGTWRAMEECQKLGLSKSIGVSNFSSAKISRLLKSSVITPAVNQVEMNVRWNQQRLRELCDKEGIRVTAYSPLGANGMLWGSDAVMNSDVLKDIAARKGKTVAQVALRWLYEQDVCFVVKSFNKERMGKNMAIFDWGLSDDEEMIAQIPQRRLCIGEVFVSPNGPYTSVEELWDGEM